MKTHNVFILIDGVELVLRRGEWIRVPTTILYTGEDSEFWEVVRLEAKEPLLVLESEA